MSIWFYLTIVIGMLVAQDLYLKKMKNEVRLKELDVELRKLELEKQTLESTEKMK